MPPEKLIPESQLKLAIREILAEMLGIPLSGQMTRQWRDTDPAFAYLGLDSAEQLREMVRSGLLRVGSEVRDIRASGSEKPRYQFHLSKCEARLCELPERRSATRRGRPRKAA